MTDISCESAICRALNCESSKAVQEPGGSALVISTGLNDLLGFKTLFKSRHGSLRLR